MAERARYRPSEYHKARSAASRGSTARAPRPDKTICDGHRRSECPDARSLLRAGFRCGMVSEQRRGDWPQNVWAVDDDGIAYEAQLTNLEVGEYHGYPMVRADSFTRFIAAEWNRRSQ